MNRKAGLTAAFVMVVATLAACGGGGQTDAEFVQEMGEKYPAMTNADTGERMDGPKTVKFAETICESARELGVLGAISGLTLVMEDREATAQQVREMPKYVEELIAKYCPEFDAS